MAPAVSLGGVICREYFYFTPSSAIAAMISEFPSDGGFGRTCKFVCVAVCSDSLLRTSATKDNLKMETTPRWIVNLQRDTPKFVFSVMELM